MATSKQQSSSVMERRAINSSGCLGSLYDGCRDRIIEKSNTICQEQHFPSSEPPQCKLINGNTDESNNLLQYIGIQDELRLSLSLKMTKRDGIGAVLEYSRPIDNFTRFLYYFWIAREHRIQRYPQLGEITGIWNRCLSVTHIITSVHIGIDVIVVLQLPSEPQIANKIDYILKKIPDILLRNELNNLKLSPDENNALGHIVNIRVYSNIPDLTESDKFSDVLQQIVALKENTTRCRPLSYTLQTIISLYPTHMLKAVTFKSLSPDLVKDIEQYMLLSREMMRYSEALLEENVSKKSWRHLRRRFIETGIQFKYNIEIQRIANLVVKTRSEQVDTSEIYQALRCDKEITLNKTIRDFFQNLKEFNVEDYSISDFQQKVFQYWNTARRIFNKSEDTNNFERNYVNRNPCDRTLNSNDILNTNNQFKLASERPRSTEEDKDNALLIPSDLDLPFQTENMPISPLDENPSKHQISSQRTHFERVPNAFWHVRTFGTRSLPVRLDLGSPEDFSQSSSIVPSSTDEIINILLLGETGVGKSTFINAFANYLTFDSLTQAQSSEPIVIIPVSFIITVGDNFEEHEVKFGEFDNSNNENFNKVGQSVTQHCKSYLFDFHHIDGKKLCIIDTPGFGDTRGLEQDDRNMEHILQYINNLSHLNAICFLLKPNSSRLNMFFRTCLTQLFSFLAPTARENVIFCFTNARSTFYTPGDTAPLLRAMLASSSITDIPFKKDNVFCFDSESFRYLVALQNTVPFSTGDKEEYEKSWSISVKESNRLIDYIDKKLFPYHMEHEWQSIKHAQFEISHMIRPMLEAMRNFLRNQILYEKNFPNQLIELHPNPLHRIAIRCRSCKPHIHEVGKFWIISDLPHKIQTGLSTCSCASDRHVPIDYTLEYELSNNTCEYDPEKMTAIVTELCEACAKFAHFLMHVAGSTKDDPFLIGLAEMIEEEDDICSSQNQTIFNQRLVEELKKVENRYEQFGNTMKSDQECMKLPAVYKLIKSIGECLHVREQMVAVKETQQLIMKQHEYEPQKI